MEDHTDFIEEPQGSVSDVEDDLVAEFDNYVSQHKKLQKSEPVGKPPKKNPSPKEKAVKKRQLVEDVQNLQTKLGMKVQKTTALHRKSIPILEHMLQELATDTEQKLTGEDLTPSESEYTESVLSEIQDDEDDEDEDDDEDNNHPRLPANTMDFCAKQLVSMNMMLGQVVETLSPGLGDEYTVSGYKEFLAENQSELFDAYIEILKRNPEIANKIGDPYLKLAVINILGIATNMKLVKQGLAQKKETIIESGTS